ncbi:MAG TPA: hypothetical protein P5080_02825 [Candidatus Paceibacterota bacterium]|nr:hypothetical protein [Candidatus Pacearchaeota archaeon]HRZ50903.1 hypothetical protein [Candidatus Paceibacterota bacterium]HSA36624.1 hypothetical protein [Candidatus Paceibacterota bacterium]
MPSKREPRNDNISVSDLRLFEILFHGEGKESSIITEDNLDLMLEAKKRLHFDPGINPFNQKKAARASVMRAGKPYFNGPFVWERPASPVINQNGVSILSWKDYSILWPLRISNKASVQGDAFCNSGRREKDMIFVGDLRQVEISTSQGWVAEIVREQDVKKFLDSQRYLGSVAFESCEGLVLPIDCLPKASVAIQAIRTYDLKFFGPYWHTCPELAEDARGGARVVSVGACRTIFDRYKG